MEGSQNYLLLLLHLIDKADVDMHLRVGASITCKNFVKRNWKVVSTNTVECYPHAPDLIFFQNQPGPDLELQIRPELKPGPDSVKLM